MFSLNDSMRYMLYNQPTDMRKSYHTLSGIVSNCMGCDPSNGDVYIFMNKTRNRVKLLHWEPGGMVIYSKLLETGTFGYPSDIGKDELTGLIEWRDLVLIVEGIIEKPDSRKQRLDSLKKLRKYE
jgi:transposase